MPSTQRILVAFLLPEALRDVLLGVTRYAKEHRKNWQILTVNANEFAANFAGNRADGAIVQLRPESRAVIRKIRQSPTPVVNLLRDLSPAIPSVLSDNHAIGQAGATYLRGLGFRKLAFVSLDTVWSHQRLAGFADSLKEAGLEPPMTTESLGVQDFRFISQVRALKLLGKWASRLGPRTAVMAPSDFVARTLIHAAEAHGIEVPKDLAVLGVDNFLPICEMWPLPLSSIAQDFGQMGFEAAGLLDEQMRSRIRPKGRSVIIPPGRIHVRASTDVMAFDDPLIAQAMRIIHEQVADITITQLLERIPLSRRWLDERFKLAVGHTPSEEIRKRRLRIARDLLLETDLPLRVIAQRCRFNFAENLIRSFRAEYGMSPHSYRVRHRVLPSVPANTL